MSYATAPLAYKPGPGVFVPADALTLPRLPEVPPRLAIMPSAAERRIVLTLLASQLLSVIGIAVTTAMILLGYTAAIAVLILSVAAFFFVLGMNTYSINKLATALELRREAMVHRAVGDDTKELADLEKLINPPPATTAPTVEVPAETFKTASPSATHTRTRRGNISVGWSGIFAEDRQALSIKRTVDADFMAELVELITEPVPPPDYTKFNAVKDQQVALHAEAQRMADANAVFGRQWEAERTRQLESLMNQIFSSFVELRAVATELDQHPASDPNVKRGVATSMNQLTDRFEDAHKHSDVATLKDMPRDIHILVTACRDYIDSQAS